MAGDASITIVSGLPRSGTSMMMKMLAAGGLPLVVDRQRQADPDNPQGYYEFERVKKVATDQAWLPECQGKAVKMVSMLLLKLPPGYEYRVIFMRRDMPEILASQARMLERLAGKGDGIPDTRMAALFTKHLAEVDQWLAGQPHIRVLNCEYREAIAHPRACAERVAAFLQRPLDLAAMAAAVDASLYRNRAETR